MRIALLGYLILPILILSVGCGQRKSLHGEEPFLLTPSIYYKPVVYMEQEKCSSNDLRDMKNGQGKVLATLCAATYKNCLMQGSCYVISKGETKMVGFAGTSKENVYKFLEVDFKRCPYGWGVKEICIEPYFSIAADPAFYKAGDVIYVPKLVNVALPDGQIHDGYVVVRDEGGGIKGRGRFDFFTGLLNHLSKKNPFARLGFGDPDNRFEFRKVDGDEARAARERRNYPGIPKAVLEGFSL